MLRARLVREAGITVVQHHINPTLVAVCVNATRASVTCVKTREGTVYGYAAEGKPMEPRVGGQQKNCTTKGETEYHCGDTRSPLIFTFYLINKNEQKSLLHLTLIVDDLDMIIEDDSRRRIAWIAFVTKDNPCELIHVRLVDGYIVAIKFVYPMHISFDGGFDVILDR